MPMKNLADGAFVLRKNKDDPSKIDLIATKQNLSGDLYHWRTFEAAMELKEIKGKGLFIRYVKGKKGEIRKIMKKAVQQEKKERKKPNNM